MTYTLSDPFRNRVIAADTLEREGEDILYLQAEFARAVVSAVKVAVTPTEQTLLAGGQKVNPEAYDLYMKGFNAYRISYNYTEGLDYLNRAIDIDPDFALARVYRGLLYSDMGTNGYIPEKVAYPKAREDVERALELDNNLAIAQATMGWLRLIMDWDFSGAESTMKKALDLEPGNHDIQMHYGIFLRVMGRHDESIKVFTKLQKSLPPGYNDILASAYLWAGRLDEGVDIAEKTFQENPSDLNKFWLALAYTLKGNYPEALHLYNELMSLPEYAETSQIDLAIAYALSGKREEALAAMEKAKNIYADKGVEPEFYLACVYAALGENDKAIDFLNLAFEKRAGVLVNLRTFPYLRSLHGDPRFEELVKKMGFPDVPQARSKNK